MEAHSFLSCLRGKSFLLLLILALRFTRSVLHLPTDLGWWPALSETISSCLSKHLEQLSTHTVPLSEALGNLSLDTTPNSLPGACPARSPLKCVCYGLGNFSTCVIARHQLAFLRLFLEKYQVLWGSSGRKWGASSPCGCSHWG